MNAEDQGTKGREWVVMRQDDNGNEAVVRRFPSEAEARGLAAEMEALGHKQMYWVEPHPPTDQ